MVRCGPRSWLAAGGAARPHVIMMMMMMLPIAARADCTVAALQAPANGVLGTACQPFATLLDGDDCALTCHAGFTRTGVQPSCTGSTFDPGSIVCTVDIDSMMEYIVNSSIASSPPAVECASASEVESELCKSFLCTCALLRARRLSRS